MNLPKLACLLLMVAMSLAVPTCAHAGYTHYFTWKETPNKESLKQCIAEMQKLIADRGTALAGPDGDGNPVLAPDHIEFNGVGDDAHEPFVFPGGNGFIFCKTQWKPYDAVVVACLFVARDHFSPQQLEIASDGEGEADAFQDGCQLYVETFSRQPKDLFSGGNVTPVTVAANRIPRWLAVSVLAVLFVILIWWFRSRQMPAF